MPPQHAVREPSLRVPHARRWVQTLLWSTLALAALQALSAWVSALKLLALPYETSRPESFILHGALRLVHGQALYPPLRAVEPWFFHVYNPLSYLPAAAAGWLLDPSPRAVATAGRCVAYVSQLAIGVLCAITVWRSTRAREPALFAAVVPWCFHLATACDFFRLRPESPALLFTLSGAFAILLAERRAWLVAAVAFFVAFLFKQSFIAAPIATAVYLALEQPRDALRFCATYGALVGAFLGLMFVLTGPSYFEHTMLSMAANEVRPVQQLQRLGPSFVAIFWGPLLALGPALAILVRARQVRFLLVYLVVSSLWSLYSFGKAGADLNYFCEWATLVLTLEAFALAAAAETERRYWRQLSVLVPVGAHVLLVAIFFGPLGAPIRVPYVDLSAQVARYRAVREHCLITHEGVAIHSGHVVAFDWYLLDLLRAKGLFSAVPLLGAVRSGEYARVVLNRHPTSQLEVDIFQTLQKAPYRMTYRDALVLEWTRSTQAEVQPDVVPVPNGSPASH